MYINYLILLVYMQLMRICTGLVESMPNSITSNRTKNAIETHVKLNISTNESNAKPIDEIEIF